MVLAAVLTVGAWHDAALLTRYSVAPGIDGYYYVLQIEALKHEHRLYFSTQTPATLYFLTFFSYLTRNPVAAIKSAVVLLHVLLGLGVFALLTATTQNVWLAVLGTGLVVVSGLHPYMISEFIKVLGAATPFLWASWLIVRFAQTRRSRYLFPAIALFALAFLGHTLLLAVGLTIAVCVLLVWSARMFSRKSGFLFALAVLALAAYLGPAILKSQAVIDIPERLQLELRAIPQWPVTRTYLAEALMLALFAPATLIFVGGQFRARVHNAGLYVFGGLALWTLFVTLNPFVVSDNGWMGIVGRIRGLAYLQVALLVPGVMWLLMASGRRRSMLYVLSLAPAFVILSVRSPLPPGLSDDYLLRRELLVRSLPQSSARLDHKAIILAAHGDQFLITHILKMASQQLAPENLRQDSTYWLLDVPQPMSLPAAVVVERGEFKTIIVEDGVMRSYLRAANQSDKLTLLGNNRHLLMAYNRGGTVNPFLGVSVHGVPPTSDWEK